MACAKGTATLVDDAFLVFIQTDSILVSKRRGVAMTNGNIKSNKKSIDPSALLVPFWLRERGIPDQRSTPGF